jgi:Lsr2
MVQRTQIIISCDQAHDGGDDEIITDEGTTEFSFQGVSYEIDLCAAHKKQLDDVIGPVIASARRASPGAFRSTRRTAAPAAPRQRDRAATTRRRQWLKDQGYEVSNRGRIPFGLAEKAKQAGF